MTDLHIAGLAFILGCGIYALRRIVIEFRSLHRR